jgi:hypothetical protein
MKTCSICKQELPLSNFHKRTYASGNIGYQNKCRKCTTTVRREYYKPHEKTRQKLKISEEQYNDLMKNENCQICDAELTKKCIDHCHSTKQHRTGSYRRQHPHPPKYDRISARTLRLWKPRFVKSVV